MSFAHEFARAAKIWSSEGFAGKSKKLLVVVTDLETEKSHKDFDAEKIGSLSSAGEQWIKDNPKQAGDLLIMTRPKKWNGDKA